MAAMWRRIFFQLFFRIPSKPGIYTCETENEAAAAILVLSIHINRSYFQLIAL